MSDEHTDRLVRDADPYRGVGSLDGERQSLLEEIMSTPILAAAGEPRPRGRFRRTTAAVAAAAALIGVLTASTLLLRGGSGDGPGIYAGSPSAAASAPSAIASTPSAIASAPSADASGPGSAASGPPASKLDLSKQGQRLWIGEPGWTVTTVYGFTGSYGEIRFTRDGLELEMDWYAAEQYDGYYQDRLEVSAPQPATVDGWAGDVFTYSADDFAIMLHPRGSVFVEMRTTGHWDRATFDRVLASIERVDLRTWTAALPADVITAARARQAATDMLTDVPLPPGFDAGSLADAGTNSYYHFGVAVISRVGCGWIAQWQRAERDGDGAALRQAADALSGSHRWTVLNRMNPEGDWPESFWDIADSFAAGHPQPGWAESLGCS